MGTETNQLRNCPICTSNVWLGVSPKGKRGKTVIIPKDWDSLIYYYEIHKQ